MATGVGFSHAKPPEGGTTCVPKSEFPPPVLVGRQRSQKDLGFDPALSLKTLISARIWGFLDESR